MEKKTEFTRMDAMVLVELLDRAAKKHEMKCLFTAARAIRKKYDLSEKVRIIVSMAIIQKIVAHHYGVTVQQITSASRIEEFRRPRDVAYHVATLLTSNSVSGIGRSFNKNHSTVIHAMKKALERIKTDKIYEAQIEELCEKCITAATIERQRMERNVQCLIDQQPKPETCPTKNSLMSAKQH